MDVRRPSKRRVAIALAMALLCGALALTLARSAPGTQPRPNLLVIVTDDQTTESMRIMEQVRSRIGERGATFARSYVNFPLCCPSRATLLTGQYAHNHRVLDNDPPAGGFDRFEGLHGTSNLATWLQDAGYRTGLVGKYFNGYGDEDSTFVPPGWDDWVGAVAPAQHVYDYDLNVDGTLEHHGTKRKDFKGDVLTDHAIELVQRNAASTQPFFLKLAYTAPHAAGPNPSPQPPGDCPAAPKPPPRYAHAFDDEPLPHPPNFNEGNIRDKPPGVRRRPKLGPNAKGRLRRRYRCTLESLRGVDEEVARLLEALEGTGEADNTLVVFTSDNGLFFGEHRIPGGKVRHYEESTRVPLVISGPGIAPGTSVAEPVINADLAPTLLDAAGAEPDVPSDGISLLPAARGDSLEDGLGRDLLLESTTYDAIRSGRWVYVEHRGGRNANRELYDLEADPYELRNLARARRYRPLVGELSPRLAGLRDCAGAGCSERVAPPSGP